MIPVQIRDETLCVKAQGTVRLTITSLKQISSAGQLSCSWNINPNKKLRHGWLPTKCLNTLVYVCLNDLEPSNHHPYVIMFLGEPTLGPQNVAVLCEQTHRVAPVPAQSPSIQVQCGYRQSTTQTSLWLGTASCGCLEGYHCETVRGEADTCCLQSPGTWRRIRSKSVSLFLDVVYRVLSGHGLEEHGFPNYSKWLTNQNMVHLGKWKKDSSK